MIALNKIVDLLLAYKYFILFPIATIEGPIISIIAGFLAFQGYLNIFITYFSLVIADLTGDSLYYAIGRFGGRAFVERWGPYLGLKESALLSVENHFEKHAGKTLFFGKLHAAGGLVLAGAGAARMKYSKFLWMNFILTLGKSMILLAIGYFFGREYAIIDAYFSYGGLIMVIVTVVVLAALYFIYRKRNHEKNSIGN